MKPRRCFNCDDLFQSEDDWSITVETLVCMLVCVRVCCVYLSVCVCVRMRVVCVSLCVGHMTVQVVPLSQRSGIVEWCEGTVPLGEYLVNAHTGAHLRYNPRDWPSKLCRQKMEVRHLDG